MQMSCLTVAPQAPCHIKWLTCESCADRPGCQADVMEMLQMAVMAREQLTPEQHSPLRCPKVI